MGLLWLGSASHHSSLITTTSPECAPSSLRRNFPIRSELWKTAMSHCDSSGLRKRGSRFPPPTPATVIIKPSPCVTGPGREPLSQVCSQTTQPRRGLSSLGDHSGRPVLQTEPQDMLQGPAALVSGLQREVNPGTTGMVPQRKPPADVRIAFPGIPFLSAPIPAQRGFICNKWNISKQGEPRFKGVCDTHKNPDFSAKSPKLHVMIEGFTLQNDLPQASSNSAVSLMGISEGM